MLHERELLVSHEREKRCPPAEQDRFDHDDPFVDRTVRLAANAA
jgi:hypothetical protein